MEKPFAVTANTQMNTRTGTILIPNETCPVGISWPDCSCDLFELIAEEHNTTHVSYFTTNLRGKCCKNYSQRDMIFQTVYIGGALYKVKPYLPPTSQCQNYWRFRHPSKYCGSTACCLLLCKLHSRT